jgi:hypothetical protein
VNTAYLCVPFVTVCLNNCNLTCAPRSLHHPQGEKRLEEIGRLTSATAKLMTMFEDPWEELTFRNVGNQGRIFNAVEDRFLLCLTHLHG